MKQISEFLNNNILGSVLKIVIFLGMMWGMLQTVSARLDSLEKSELKRTDEIVSAMEKLNTRTTNLEIEAAEKRGSVTTKLDNIISALDKMDARVARLEQARFKTNN